MMTFFSVIIPHFLAQASVSTLELNIPKGLWGTLKRMMGNWQSGKQATWDTLREWQFWALLVPIPWPENLGTLAQAYPALPAQNQQEENNFIMIRASVSPWFLVFLGRCLGAWSDKLGSLCPEHTEQGYDRWQGQLLSMPRKGHISLSLQFKPAGPYY